MSINIRYNNDGKVKIIENGEVKDNLELQWEKNSIDQSILNNINRTPKVLLGERIGLGGENGANQQMSEFNVEIEINGSNFITDDSQRVLMNPIVTDTDNGDVITDDEYTSQWYLNGELLDVPNIFELNTSQLKDEYNNIIKLEVLVNDIVLVDKVSILKYLGFTSGSDDNNGREDDDQTAGGGVIDSDEGIRVIGSFKTNDIVTFVATGNGNDGAIWSFGDGDGGEGLQIKHSYDNAGIYNIEARVMKDFEVYNPKAKIKIV